MNFQIGIHGSSEETEKTDDAVQLPATWDGKWTVDADADRRNKQQGGGESGEMGGGTLGTTPEMLTEDGGLLENRMAKGKTTAAKAEAGEQEERAKEEEKMRERREGEGSGGGSGGSQKLDDRMEREKEEEKMRERTGRGKLENKLEEKMRERRGSGNGNLEDRMERTKEKEKMREREEEEEAEAEDGVAVAMALTDRDKGSRRKRFDPGGGEVEEEMRKAFRAVQNIMEHALKKHAGGGGGEGGHAGSREEKT